jgi:hypothetical protein
MLPGRNLSLSLSLPFSRALAISFSLSHALFSQPRALGFPEGAFVLSACTRSWPLGEEGPQFTTDPAIPFPGSVRLISDYLTWSTLLGFLWVSLLSKVLSPLGQNHLAKSDLLSLLEFPAKAVHVRKHRCFSENKVLNWLFFYL